MNTAQHPNRATARSSGPNDGAIVEASPRDVQMWLARGEAVLVDVREPDEHQRERVLGARLMPLSRFDPEQASRWVAPGQSLVVHCRSGRRSADACRLANKLAARGVRVVNMTGGIEAWKQASLPVEANAKVASIGVMRQVQLTIGVLALAGSALAWFVHPGFVAIPAILGAGLAFAGATGGCALASLVARMPWNRGTGSATSCSSGSCG